MADVDDIVDTRKTEEADTYNERIREMLRSEFGFACRSKRSEMVVLTRDNDKEFQKANRLFRQQIKRLKKQRRDVGLSDDESDLLRTLTSCKRDAPCASAACPKCTRALQRAMSTLHCELRGVGIKLDACLTVIAKQKLPDGKASLDDLASNDPEHDDAGEVAEFLTDLHEAFDEAGVGYAIGGIDIAWHEFRGDKHEPHGRPHLHALVWRNQVTAGRRRLDEVFRRSDCVNRPIQLEAFDGKDDWLRYSLRYPNNRTIRSQDDQGLWQESTYKRCTVEQQIRQAVLLAKMGWSGRIFLRGVALELGHSGWRLALADFQAIAIPQVRRKR